MHIVHPIGYIGNKQQGVGILNNTILDVLEVQCPTTDTFQLWCNIHRVTYYSRPKEDFHPVEGMEQALANGSRYLLMNNLS